MEHYFKSRTVEDTLLKKPPFLTNDIDFLWVKVRANSKVQNLVKYALEDVKNNKRTLIVWTANGNDILKAVSCVEMFKRFYNVSQITKIEYKKVEEYWSPKKPGLEEIVVERDVPSIVIVLTMKSFSDLEIGYQHYNENYTWHNRTFNTTEDTVKDEENLTKDEPLKDQATGEVAPVEPKQPATASVEEIYAMGLQVNTKKKGKKRGNKKKN